MRDSAAKGKQWSGWSEISETHLLFSDGVIEMTDTKDLRNKTFRFGEGNHEFGRNRTNQVRNETSTAPELLH